MCYLSCSDQTNLLKETLERQFELVRNRTSRNGSYVQGSHVLQFGSKIIDEEPASDYLGSDNTGELKSIDRRSFLHVPQLVASAACGMHCLADF